jgi:hypothetical protein
VACRSDANRDLRTGIECEETTILVVNDNEYFESLTMFQSLRKAHQLSAGDLCPTYWCCDICRAMSYQQKRERNF